MGEPPRCPWVTSVLLGLVGAERIRPCWWQSGVWGALGPGGRGVEACTVLGTGDPKPGRTPWQRRRRRKQKTETVGRSRLGGREQVRGPRKGPRRRISRARQEHSRGLVHERVPCLPRQRGPHQGPGAARRPQDGTGPGPAPGVPWSPGTAPQASAGPLPLPRPLSTAEVLAAV